jgi:hypothetical protein
MLRPGRHRTSLEGSARRKEKRSAGYPKVSIQTQPAPGERGGEKGGQSQPALSKGKSAARF